MAHPSHPLDTINFSCSLRTTEDRIGIAPEVLTGHTSSSTDKPSRSALNAKTFPPKTLYTDGGRSVALSSPLNDARGHPNEIHKGLVDIRSLPSHPSRLEVSEVEDRVRENSDFVLHTAHDS